MTYILRPYQQQAVQAMIESTKNRNKDIVCLPTGAGKSLVIADFVSKHGKPVIILQPSREILKQNKEKLLTYVDKSKVGVYSASFNKKEVRQYTFATIQSVFKKADLFTEFSTVIIDEVHMYKKKGMYDKFFKKFNNPKIIGLTATPYRMIQKKDTNYKIRQMVVMSVLRMMTQEGFDDIIYSISTKELTDMGYLAPLQYIDQIEIPANFNLNSDKKIVEEFQLRLTLGNMDKIRAVLGMVDEPTIVFTPGVNIARLLSNTTPNSAFVSGETKKKERDQILKDFKKGIIKIIFNDSVLTTGFDYPGLENIVVLRPTKSLNLWNQMIGRLTRTFDGKTEGVVYDLTGTTKHLGELKDIVVMKDDEGEWSVKTAKGWMRNKIMSYHKVNI